ncbi:hypothetical protein ZWY2020_005720 [Hordeum vulgare]|nr:hypothetical protein ZWY2020_005720 [Hordeum vulgare]
MAGISPSILIIAVIVVVMLLASISIHYFIRSLCRRSPSSSSSSGPSAPPLPLVAVRSSAVAPAAAAADQGKEAAAERERLIGRLPLFTLASSLAALPRSSRDCAVCQCVFCGDDELRLLPACRHAFHSGCVDPWLRANPSCPLCRASIALPYPPLPELLRVELGSVSSRRSTSSSSSSSAAVAAAPPEGARAYPLPNSSTNTEYLVEEDLQVVLKPPSAANPAPAPPPTARITGEPSQQLAAAGERGLSSSFRSVGRSSSRWSNCGAAAEQRAVEQPVRRRERDGRRHGRVVVGHGRRGRASVAPRRVRGRQRLLRVRAVADGSIPATPANSAFQRRNRLKPPALAARPAGDADAMQCSSNLETAPKPDGF